MENVDETIEALCSKIQKLLDEGRDHVVVVEMTKALAELVTASAHANTLKL